LTKLTVNGRDADASSRRTQLKTQTHTGMPQLANTDEGHFLLSPAL